MTDSRDMAKVVAALKDLTREFKTLNSTLKTSNRKIDLTADAVRNISDAVGPFILTEDDEEENK